MATEPTYRLTPQLILGLLVIVAGVLFTLDNFGYIYADEYLRYWPVGIILIGAVKLVQSDHTPGRLAGSLFLLVGIALLLDSLYGVDFNPLKYWPLILVFVGGMLVWQALARSEDGKERREGDSDSYLRSLAILGGVERTNHSSDFRGGEVTAVLGGCEIDLSRAAITAEQAVLNVFTMWGGINIRVPDEWTVVIEGFPIMGGLADKTRPPRQPEPRPQRLVVRGIVIMGGVEIKN